MMGVGDGVGPGPGTCIGFYPVFRSPKGLRSQTPENQENAGTL